MKRTYLAIAVLVTSIGVSGPARAVTQDRANLQTAVNNCQPALPSFDGAFRKRPLGIVNQSSSTAFISCGSSVEILGSLGVNSLTAIFFNRNAVPVDISCTLANGISAPFSRLTFFPKTVTAPAGDSLFVTWGPAEHQGDLFLAPSISCGIPPNVEINATQTNFDTDVGN